MKKPPVFQFVLVAAILCGFASAATARITDAGECGSPPKGPCLVDAVTHTMACEHGECSGRPKKPAAAASAAKPQCPLGACETQGQGIKPGKPKKPAKDGGFVCEDAGLKL